MERPYQGARTAEEREVFRHGRLAGQRGQPHYDNPYAFNTPTYELWLEGWREAVYSRPRKTMGSRTYA